MRQALSITRNVTPTDIHIPTGDICTYEHIKTNEMVKIYFNNSIAFDAKYWLDMVRFQFTMSKKRFTRQAFSQGGQKQI